MPSLPRRHSLVDETASVLRERLDEGEWTAFLPGEIQLASLLHVGRNTVRSALQLLESEGRLRSRNGVRREIVPCASGNEGERRAVLLMARPENEYPPSTSAWIAETRSRLENLDWSFRTLVEPGAFRSKPAGILRSLTAGLSGTVWILHRSTPATQHWFQDQRLPVVLAGSRHEGISLPQVEIDLRAVSRHAAGRFLGKGHRNLAVLRPEGSFAGDAECLAAFRDGATGCTVADLRFRGGTAGVVQTLRRALARSGFPTGIYVLHAEAFAAALSFLQSEGVRIPERVSLVCREDEPYLSFLHPEPSRYSHSPKTFASRLASLVGRPDLGRSRTRQSSLVMPRAIEGDTLATPPVPERNR